MAPVDWLVKFTVNGGWQLVVLGAVNAATGRGKTLIGLEEESVQYEYV